MDSKKYQKFQIELASERKKNSICRNELQRKIYDIAVKDLNGISNNEFWSFYHGFTKCLELNENQFNELKKLF